MPEYVTESFMGSGDLQMAILDANDVPQGELDVGNASAFVIAAPSIEKKEQKGSRRANFGQTITSIVSDTEQEVKITLTDITRDNLVKAMFGADSDYSQAAGNNTGTPEEIVAREGKWAKLDNRNLDPATPPVVTNSGGATTYDVDVDYEVDYQVGRIYVIPGGAITDADTLEVTYTWLVQSGFSIKALENLTFNVFLRLIGRNEADQSDHEVIVNKAQLEPAGDLGWISEDLSSIELTGKILSTPAGTWELIKY